MVNNAFSFKLVYRELFLAAFREPNALDGCQGGSIRIQDAIAAEITAVFLRRQTPLAPPMGAPAVDILDADDYRCGILTLLA